MLKQKREKIDLAADEVSLFQNSIARDLSEAGFHLGRAIETFLEWLIDENKIKFFFHRPTIQEKVKELQKKNIIEKLTAQNLISCYSWRGYAVHGKSVNKKQAKHFYELIKDIIWRYWSSSKNEIEYKSLA